MTDRTRTLQRYGILLALIWALVVGMGVSARAEDKGQNPTVTPTSPPPPTPTATSPPPPTPTATGTPECGEKGNNPGDCGGTPTPTATGTPDCGEKGNNPGDCDPTPTPDGPTPTPDGPTPTPDGPTPTPDGPTPTPDEPTPTPDGPTPTPDGPTPTPDEPTPTPDEPTPTPDAPTPTEGPTPTPPDPTPPPTPPPTPTATPPPTPPLTPSPTPDCSAEQKAYDDAVETLLILKVRKMELESDKTRIGAELNRKKTELENARKEKEDKELEKDDLETIRKQCLDQLQADLKACGADLSVATDKSLDELLDLALACLGGGPLGPGACMREALHYAASLEEIDNALNCIQVNLARKEGCYRNDARIATLAARIKQLLDIIRVLRPQVDKLEKHYQDILTTLSDVIDLMSYWEGKKQQALDAWDRCKRGE